MWGDSCFQLTPGAAKIAYSEIASTKNEILRVILWQYNNYCPTFSTQDSEMLFSFAFLRSIMTQKQLGQLNTHSVNNKASSKSGSEAG